MKTILVPTDYSDIADNALRYAIELAKLSKAKIILLHAYQIPLPAGDAPVLMVSPLELEKENLVRIKKLEKKFVKELAGKVKIEHIINAGFITDEILTVAKEKKADLIVMGVTGVGKVAEALIGSNTTALIKKTQIPVLVIPKDARYKKISKIVLAYDSKGKIEESVMEKIKNFILLFKSKVLVLDIVKPAEGTSSENAKAHKSAEKALDGIKHTLYFLEGYDFEYEMNSFVDTYKADWLIMIPHKNKFLTSLFHKSNTKKMAFHTHIPLLSLHE
jgi:nucleotide-binding universal stress UspA family protein